MCIAKCCRSLSTIKCNQVQDFAFELQDKTASDNHYAMEQSNYDYIRKRKWLSD